MMTKELEKYIETHQLFDIKKDKILLAISGGVDSVVLAHLFRQAGVHFALAHCNFQLRGEESQGDADFVRDLAARLGLPLFETSFDTMALVASQKESIQLVARQLRYEWLEEIRQKHGFDYIATAHHLDDAIETFFMHLLDGCGIRGLQGIRPKNEAYFLRRPLGFATKQQLLEYAQSQAITYREDSSNTTDKYYRNEIRHHLMPVLAQIQPQLYSVFAANFQRLKDAETLYLWGLEQWKARVCSWDKDILYIDIEQLKTIEIYKTLLFEILQPYFFNIEQIEQLLSHEQSGAFTDGPNHRLLRDRNVWMMIPLEKMQLQTQSIALELDKNGGVLETPFFTISYRFYPKTSDFQPQKIGAIAYFDAALLAAPLRLRVWRAGDRFHPLGMDGKSKKVSDLLKDSKVNVYEKNNTWLLLSDEKVAWLLGLRADERFRVTAETKEICEMVLVKK